MNLCHFLRICSIVTKSGVNVQQLHHITTCYSICNYYALQYTCDKFYRLSVSVQIIQERKGWMQ